MNPALQSFNTQPPAAADPLRAYEALVSHGKIKEDPEQKKAMQRLQTLYAELKDAASSKPGRLASFFGKPRRKTPRGIYLWGSVGRGKTMLMDLFFNAVGLENKRRMHFHAFMQEVHARIHALRREHSTEAENPVALLAEQIAQETRLLCLDEFQVTDVADAMILSLLFTTLLDHGTVVVTTSNNLPENLYQGGLQRDRYLKFAGLVHERLDIVTVQSPEDYRLQQIRSLHHRYFMPLGPAADRFIEEALASLAPVASEEVREIEVHGRVLSVFMRNGIACFTFDELCNAALGAADYLAIAEHFPNVILTGIPIMSPEQRNEAKRFVTLIDALYDRKTRLICTAEAAPDELYPDGTGAFEFRRAASRLMEMQSDSYFQGIEH